MPNDVFVHLLPELVELERLRGGVAVVLDVLRASTTMIHALAEGAQAVVPFERVDQARSFADRPDRDSIVLAGERGGRLIEGFDLDNSPLSCTAATVRGKTVAFTTTNGTRALLHCREADRILVGAFVNLDAVVAEAVAAAKPIHLICAGTRGRISAEDVLCAGAIARGARGDANHNWAGDVTQMAIDFYTARSVDDATFRAAMRASHGGRDLVALGFDRDIDCAASLNRFDLVPEYFHATGRIELAER